MIGIGIGIGVGIILGMVGVFGVGEVGVLFILGEVFGCGIMFCIVGMVLFWNLVVGLLGGGGGIGVCCCVGNNGMNFFGWVFWCFFIGFEVVVGWMVIVIVIVSEVKLIIVKVMIVLLISSDCWFNGVE